MTEQSILTDQEVDYLKKRVMRVPSNFEIGFSEGYDRGFKAGLAKAGQKSKERAIT